MVTLITPYALPFHAAFQAPSRPGKRDVTLRFFPASAPALQAANSMDAIVLPFCLFGTSGALAGDSIEPWTSTIKEWSKPQIRGAAIEWQLKSVNLDPRAWVMLAQMLLPTHDEWPLARMEIIDPQGRGKMIQISQGSPLVNPYPGSWRGINFPVVLEGDISKTFTVFVEFSRPVSEEKQAQISEELFAWAPGLMLGAYGVAPVPPDRCTGIPDEELIFVENEMEWDVSNFKAHTAAIDGLINVVAKISHKFVRVIGFRIE